MTEIVSPCVGICNLDADNICRGCFRSLDEVQQWFSADNQTKKRIMLNVERRKRQAQENNTS